MSFRILIAEDNDGDIFLLKKCLTEADADAAYEIIVAKDGPEVLRLLEEEYSEVGKSQVRIVLLDLNMPKLGGHEVLRRIKSDDRYKHLPVVVLSSSTQSGDIQKAYEFHANCYLKKPDNLAGFRLLCGELQKFWLSLVDLPSIKSTASSAS